MLFTKHSCLCQYTNNSENNKILYVGAVFLGEVFLQNLRFIISLHKYPIFKGAQV
jgi:hypothetical protein